MARSRVIKTKRLLIEPFSKKHLTKRYISWLNDPQVVCYSRQRHKRHTLKSCHQYLNSFKGTPDYFWAISVTDNSWGHIGNISAHIDKFNKKAALRIIMGEKKALGKGYATEAWLAICNFLFKQLKLRKIVASTIATNKKMLRLMERTGMVADGRQKKHNLWKGKEVDVVYKAIFRKDFLNENK